MENIKLTCCCIDRNGDECLKSTKLACIECGFGVCIPCNLPCFECGEPLHDHCRDDHAKTSGHRVDGPAGMPKISLRPIDGELVDALVAGALRIVELRGGAR